MLRIDKTRSKPFLPRMRMVAAGSILFALVMRADGGDRANLERVFGTARRDDAGAAAAFESIVPVLHHPRCINCHSQGDYPRQGDDEHRHAMNVRRGREGFGAVGVKCSSCHQDHNLGMPHAPPGAPDWHLPSPERPMIWEGLSDRRLCELFKDRSQNGNRSVDEIVEHMTSPLVLWGWNPGEGRTPIPTPQTEFLAKVREWASKGAACPADQGAVSALEGRTQGGKGQS